MASPRSVRISFEEFSAAVRKNGFPEPSHSTYCSFLNEAGNVSIFDKEELAMVLAHFIHDSDGFVQRRENVVEAKNYPENPDKDSNCDALLCVGRGIFSDDRLVKNKIAAADEETAMKVGFSFWNKKVVGNPDVTYGQFGASTNAISGSAECNGKNTHIAKKRYEIYKNVRKAFNLSDNLKSSEEGCYEIVNDFMNASKKGR